jgi:hypothetical protein
MWKETVTDDMAHPWPSEPFQQRDRSWMLATGALGRRWSSCGSLSSPILMRYYLHDYIDRSGPSATLVWCVGTDPEDS